MLLLALLAAGNFATDDPALRNALEAARWRSAVFWSGRELPGRWAEPCPVAVRPNDSLASAGGVTRFALDGGEAFGWRMTLEGPRLSMLADAAPHEVDHMVRASLLRRPLPRWIDEGAAAVWESRREHERLRRASARGLDRGVALDLLAMDYPRDPAAVEATYAVGFVLVERLLRDRGPQATLALQRDLAGDDATRRRDAVDIAERALRGLRAGRRVVSCEVAGCPMHTRDRIADVRVSRCVGPTCPTLVVWTADWCGACQRLKRDLQSDTAFAAALRSRVRMEIRDAGRDPLAAKAAGIRSLPTFVLGGQTKVGYRRPGDLLAAIDVQLARSRQPPVSEPTSRPASLQPARPKPASQKPSAPQPPVEPPVRPTSEPVVASGPIAPAENPASPHVPNDPLRIGRWILTAGEVAGLLGGSGATAAVMGLAWLIGRRRRRHPFPRPDTGGRSPPEPLRPAEPILAPSEPVERPDRIPFPRRLDEARELLQLRQREGRVAVLDALRGLVVDDELARLESEPEHAETARSLRALVDARVAEIAPLSTRVDG